MEMTVIQNRLHQIAKAFFLAGFALMTTVACGEFKVKPITQNAGGARALTDGPPAASLSQIAIALPTIIGSDNEDGSVDYLVSVDVTDGARKVNFFAYSTATGQGTPVAGSALHTSGDTNYALEVQCRDNVCSAFVILLTASDTKTGSYYQEARGYKYQYLTGLVEERHKEPKSSYDSPADVLTAFESKL